MKQHPKYATRSGPGCADNTPPNIFPARYRPCGAVAAAPLFAWEKKNLLRAAHVFVVVLGAVMIAPSPGADAGPGGGFATEWTQILNNGQLVAILGEETKGVALNARQLATQAELLRTQFLAYQNMIRNTENLPETIWGDVRTSLLDLRGVMAAANTLAGDGAALDRLLRSRMITDPLYEASPLAREEFADRYDKWSDLSQSALNAALGTARMTVGDVDSEAEILTRIAGQGRTVKGQVEAIQVGNELSASIARQLAQLRVLTAAQTEQTSLFQARWMADRDTEEAERREGARRAQEIERRRGEPKELIGSFSGRGRP